MEDEEQDVGGVIDEKHWMTCGFCGVPLLVHFGPRRWVIECPQCHRKMSQNIEPWGGEIDGLPPFLARKQHA